MKKVFITLCCVVLLLSSVSAGYCETDETTEGKLNGRWLTRRTQSTANFKGDELARHYCYGLMAAIMVMRGEEMIIGLYGSNTNGEEIFEAICLYYQNNPTQRSRSVIDVLLSGAK